MKFIRFITILLVSASCAFLSCYDESADKGTCPLPGGKTSLKLATAENTGENYKYTYEENIFIPSYYDGETIKIAANLYQPVAKKDGEIFPTILFMNSWALEEHEYIAQARHFVKKGYIVISYSHRGWGLSGGRASLSGPADYADFSNVLDWLIENAPVDCENIGASGISLGGGASLHALSHDSRVKTVACLSGYMDMYRSMWSDETPRMFWGTLLATTGTLLARLHTDVYRVMIAAMTNTNIDWLREWTTERSPNYYIEEINSLNKPVYIAHNLEDYLFQPDVAIDFFNDLTVDHKRLDLNQGTHATAEMPGLLGGSCYVYDNVDKWFDYWLKGIDTGIIPNKKKSAKITMEVKGSNDRVEYPMAELSGLNENPVWPAKSIVMEPFYCEPRSLVADGKLASEPGTRKGITTILSSKITGPTAGAMVLPTLEQFRVPVKCYLPALNKAEAIIYRTPALDKEKKLRGSCEATLRLSLSRSKGQVILYLYDVDSRGNGTFITHAFHTFWNAKPWQVMEVTVPFVAMAYDLPEGHSIGLVIDTFDMMYGRPDPLPFTVSLHHGTNGQSALSIPFEK